MSTRRIGSSSIGGGGGGSNVRYQTDETPGTVVGELWVDSDGTSSLVNSNDYLTKVDASAEYLSSISASNTYLSQDSASATYATQASLTSELASKLPYSYGTATPSTSDNGFLWYDSNSTPPDVKFWDGSAFQALGGGTILQVVRATDSTSRSTTSTSFVDANLSVTITPQKSDSAVVLIAFLRVEQSRTSANTGLGLIAITDSSNNFVSGAESSPLRYTDDAGTTNREIMLPITVSGYSTPATTSAVTYKVRFTTSAGTIQIQNSSQTGQLYAIEVSA